MNDRTLATLLKIMVLGLVVTILTVSAFGIGLSVGSRLPETAAVAAARSERSPAIGPGLSPTPDGTSSPDGGEGDRLIDTALYNEVWNLLQKQFYGDLPQGKDVTYALIRGLVASLGDQHTAFLDPKSAEMFNTDIEGHFEGIGARVEPAPGGGVLITYLFPGQPADKAGLQAGDILTAVDGHDVMRISLNEAISLIRGPNGSTVILTVDREGEPVRDVPVVRARIEIPVVLSKTLGSGKVAYIALSEFSSVAPSRLADAVKKALDQKPEGLILDLRGNPGGLLDAAVHVGSDFVSQGNILIERTKDGSEQAYNREGPYLLGKTPLVVLVDGGSASASEIVAGAIQDAGTGVLMGEKTYGKGSVQLPNTLSDGSQLRVTIAHWFTPKDRAIDKVGLVPNYVVPVTKADIEAKRDPQLDQAVKYLLGDRTGLMTPTPAVTPTRMRAATPSPTATPTSNRSKP